MKAKPGYQASPISFHRSNKKCSNVNGDEGFIDAKALSITSPSIMMLRKMILGKCDFLYNSIHKHNLTKFQTKRASIN
jgi:hypothetical protein